MNTNPVRSAHPRNFDGQYIHLPFGLEPGHGPDEYRLDVTTLPPYPSEPFTVVIGPVPEAWVGGRLLAVLFGFYQDIHVTAADQTFQIEVPSGYITGMTLRRSRSLVCFVGLWRPGQENGVPVESLSVTLHRPATDGTSHARDDGDGATAETRALRDAGIAALMQGDPAPVHRSTQPLTMPGQALRIGDRVGGGTFFGFTYERDTGRRYANIIAPRKYTLQDLLINEPTDSSDPDHPLRQTWHPTDSRANTEALVTHSNMARSVAKLHAEGYDDWAIPAIDVGNLMALTLYPQTTTIEAFREGGPEAFHKYASEALTAAGGSDDAYVHALRLDFFAGGIEGVSPEINLFEVRPVRRVLVR